MSPFTHLSALGRITIEPVVPTEHAQLLHDWVTHPKSVFWEMQGFTPGQTRAEFDGIDADPNHDAWLGRVDGEPVFLTETYDPGHSALAAHYPVAPGDLGMHVLVAPADTPRRWTLTLTNARPFDATAEILIPHDIAPRPTHHRGEQQQRQRSARQQHGQRKDQQGPALSDPILPGQ